MINHKRDFTTVEELERHEGITHFVDKGSLKGLEGLWFAKYQSDKILYVQIELIAQEWLRLLLPHQPESRVGSALGQEDRRLRYFLYSKEVPNFRPLTAKEGIGVYAYPGSLALLPLVLWLAEQDFKYGNLGWKEGGSRCIVKIDGEQCFAPLVKRDIKRQYNLNFSLVSEVIQSLPYPTGYRSYNWLNYRTGGKTYAVEPVIIKDRTEINRSLFKLCLLTDRFIEHFIAVYMIESDEMAPYASVFSDFLIMRRETLKIIALNDPSFLKYLNSHAVIYDCQNLIDSMQSQHYGKTPVASSIEPLPLALSCLTKIELIRQETYKQGFPLPDEELNEYLLQQSMLVLMNMDNTEQLLILDQNLSQKLASELEYTALIVPCKELLDDIAMLTISDVDTVPEQFTTTTWQYLFSLKQSGDKSKLSKYFLHLLPEWQKAHRCTPLAKECFNTLSILSSMNNWSPMIRATKRLELTKQSFNFDNLLLIKRQLMKDLQQAKDCQLQQQTQCYQLCQQIRAQALSPKDSLHAYVNEQESKIAGADLPTLANLCTELLTALAAVSSKEVAAVRSTIQQLHAAAKIGTIGYHKKAARIQAALEQQPALMRDRIISSTKPNEVQCQLASHPSLFGAGKIHFTVLGEIDIEKADASLVALSKQFPKDNPRFFQPELQPLMNPQNILGVPNAG